MGKIDDRMKMELIKSYAFRLKALGISFDYNNYKKTFNNVPNNEINNKLSLLMKNQEETINYLNKLGIKANEKVNSNNLTEKIKKQLNLSDITEFSSNGKDYFKFKSSDGQIYIVRNMGDDSKELFMHILNTSSINYIDGKKNASEIFRRLNEKKFIEIQMTKSDEINDKDKNKSQMAIIKKIETKFPEKEIIASFEENIYIVKGNTTDEDILLSASYENGKFKVRNIVQKTYGKKVDNIKNPNKKEETKSVEIPNDILEEIENDIDVNNIIEEGLNNNLNDETIVEVATNTLQAKDNKFRNINIALVINMMIARAKKARQSHNQSSNSMGGRQYVLSNNNHVNLYEDNAA